MPHWMLVTAPARLDGELTGNFADGDMKFRLHVLVDMLVKGEAAVAEAQRLLADAIASCTRNGQQRLADDARKELAERRQRTFA